MVVTKDEVMAMVLEEVIVDILNRIEVLETNGKAVCKLMLSHHVRYIARDDVDQKTHDFAKRWGLKLVEHETCGQKVWKVVDDG